jgi:hypothetical protein
MISIQVGCLRRRRKVKRRNKIMQLILDATAEELEELAKMAYVAQFVFDSSGTFSDGYKYPYTAVFDAALRKLNKAMLTLIPHSGLLEVDEQNNNVFTHTMEMEVHCKKVLDTFSNDSYLECICTELTRRDYKEKVGEEDDDMIIFGPGDVFTILYDNNMKELKANGLKRLRIEE